ncbi:hypothetical protein MferCBS31731_004211 [Microsporum ferrugineum]
MTSRPGLRWEESLFGVEPRWTCELDIKVVERIASEALALPCNATFFGQGAFNRLYHIVQCGNDAASGGYLMRVTLPVDPQFKTLSEVATLAWVRENTSLPVPRVVAYNSSHANELRFEWILMEKMAGRPLADVWGSMTWVLKEELTAGIARHSAELFSRRLSGIGNLYFATGLDNFTDRTEPSNSQKCEAARFVLGRIVSMPFFWGNHFTYDIPRGAFDLGSEWLSARLQFIQLDCEKTIRESEDEDDIEEAQKTLPVVKRLTKAIRLISREEKPTVSTVLLHDDLSMHNILVDEDGKLQGIVDWECTSTVPLWKAARFPRFLQGSHRAEKPARDGYTTGEGGENLFRIHLLEYEQTQLKMVFLEEMERESPDWVRVFQSSRNEADLDAAIENCDLHNLARKMICEWLDELESGKQPESLIERFLR